MEQTDAFVDTGDDPLPKILTTARNEYDYEPPGKYYRDGYNLYKRMERYMKYHLLFLHDKNVPSTNNEDERLLRKYKRKQAQAVSFRSQSNIDDLCQCMSMLILMRKKEPSNLFYDELVVFKETICYNTHIQNSFLYSIWKI